MQAADWQGAIGERWAAAWRATDRTFAAVDRALVDLVAARLAIVPAPRVLDIGCGAGTTSFSIAATVAQASVVGIDLSPALVAAAIVRNVDGAMCRFEIGDAARWAGADGFDLLVSRHGVMFFDDPVAAFAHLRVLARPGAPLVFSCFRAIALNPWAAGPLALLGGAPPPPCAGTPGPFAFADRGHVAALLDAAGWRDAAAVPLDYDYVVGGGDDPVAAARDFFLAIGPVAAAARDLAPAEHVRFRAALTGFLERHRGAGGVALPAAAWLWTARA